MCQWTVLHIAVTICQSWGLFLLKFNTWLDWSLHFCSGFTRMHASPVTYPKVHMLKDSVHSLLVIWPSFIYRFQSFSTSKQNLIWGGHCFSVFNSVICPPTQCNYLQIFVSPDTMWSFIQVIKVESRRRVTVARLLWMLDGKVWEWRNRKKKKSNYSCIITVEQYIRSHRRRALTQPSPCLSFCLSGNYGTGGGHPLEPGPFPQEPLGAAQSMIVLFSRTLPHETWRHRSRAPAHSRRAYMCRSGYQSRWHAAPSQHH